MHEGKEADKGLGVPALPTVSDARYNDQARESAGQAGAPYSTLNSISPSPSAPPPLTILGAQQHCRDAIMVADHLGPRTPLTPRTYLPPHTHAWPNPASHQPHRGHSLGVHRPPCADYPPFSYAPASTPRTVLWVQHCRYSLGTQHTMLGRTLNCPEGGGGRGGRACAKAISGTGLGEGTAGRGGAQGLGGGGAGHA